MKISTLLRRGNKIYRVRQAEHRDPLKVADALNKAAEGIYKLRGEFGGFRSAWNWLGEMLNDATGFSGSFYQDKELKALKDQLYNLDYELGKAADKMEIAAKRIKKEHTAKK